MRHLILAALLLGGTALAANAETFTFTGSGGATNAISVAAPGGGAPMTAVFNTSKGLTSMASGKTLPTTSTCEEHSATPPVGVFQRYGECNFTDPSGAGSILYGCNPTKDAMQANCVGGLWGTAGAYAGRSGTISWHARPSADGKSGEFAGAGQWGN